MGRRGETKYPAWSAGLDGFFWNSAQVGRRILVQYSTYWKKWPRPDTNFQLEKKEWNFSFSCLDRRGKVISFTKKEYTDDRNIFFCNYCYFFAVVNVANRKRRRLSRDTSMSPGLVFILWLLKTLEQCSPYIQHRTRVFHKLYVKWAIWTVITRSFVL
jgi:hypothetical protein